RWSSWNGPTNITCVTPGSSACARTSRRDRSRASSGASGADPTLGHRLTTRHGEQIAERVAIDVRQPDEHDWMRPVVVRHVVGVGRILEQPLAVLEPDSDDERA